MLWLVGAYPALATDVLRQRDEARAHLRAGNWQKAASAYQLLSAASPQDGGLWEALGLARLRLGEFDHAIAAYENSIACGYRVAEGHYNIACARALGGRSEDAVQALRSAFEAGFANDSLLREDQDLRALHQDVAFRELVGWPQPGDRSREERWQADLDFLRRRLAEVHWQLFRAIPQPEFDAAWAALVASIPQASDAQLRWALRQLLARVGDGHTAPALARFVAMHDGGHGSPSGEFLPLRCFWFDEGVHVVQTTPEFDDLCGAKLLLAGELSTPELLDRLLSGASADNPHGARWIAMELLVDPEVQRALGNVDLQFEFELGDGSRVRRRLPSGGGELIHQLRTPWAEWSVEPPLSGREPQRSLWMQPLDAEGLLYVRIDRVGDAAQLSLASFAEQVFATLADHAGLVLDLRHNHGGQGHLLRPFLHALIREPKLQQPGRLYVLVGRETFSAAMAFAAQIERHIPVLFVGEPTGSAPNFVGESTIVVLPYSGLRVSISSRYHQNGESNDTRRWIAPTIFVEPRSADFRRGRDAAMEAVLEQWAALRARGGVGGNGKR